MLTQQVERAGVAVVDDGLDLLVDHAAQLFAVTVRGAVISAEEHLFVAAEIHVADRLAHAPFGDHLARDRAGALDVVARARRDVVDDDLFRRPAAEHHRDHVDQLALGDVAVVAVGAGERIARRLTSGDDGHLLHLVAIFEHLRDDRVTGLVIGGDALVGIGDDAALLLRAGDDLVDAFEDVLHDDDLASRPRGEDRRLVEQVFEIRAAETAGHAREDLERHVGRERFVAAVHFEDLFPSLDVGDIDIDLSVETTGSEQRRVEDIRPVGRRHDDDAVILFEAVHLHEQLVERLLSLVVTAAEPRASLPADRVDLVDEDDAGHVALRLIEQVAHSRRAGADEHLDEIGTADREEGDVALAGDRLCEQRLTGTGRTDKEHALGDTRADRAEFLRVFEEVDDLFELFLFLFRARDVAETDGHVHAHSRLCLAEIHRLLVGARALTEDDVEHDAHDDEHYRREDERRPADPAVIVGRDLGHDKALFSFERVDVVEEHRIPRQFRDIVGVGCGIGFETLVTRLRAVDEDICLRAVDDINGTRVAVLNQRGKAVDFVAGIGDLFGLLPLVEHQPQQHYQQHHRNAERDEFDYCTCLL